jgi:hypothetical protein
LDFGSMWYLIRPDGLGIWFTRCLFILIGAHDTLRLILFVSTDTAVWLTSVHGSPQTTLPLA